MKKHILFGVIVFMGILILALTSCDSLNKNTPSETSSSTTEPADVPSTNQTVSSEHKNLVIDGSSLQEKIVWGKFVEYDSNGEYVVSPVILDGREYQHISPDSGFKSVEDVRNALLAYFSDEIVKHLMMGDDGERTYDMYIDYNCKLYYRGTVGYPFYGVWSKAVLESLENFGETTKLKISVPCLGQENELRDFYYTIENGKITWFSEEKQSQTKPNTNGSSSYASPLTYMWKIDWDVLKIYTQEELGDDITLPIKRKVYYDCYGKFTDIVGRDVWNQWEQTKKYPDEINEMHIVSAVKHFNITREQFDKANKLFYDWMFSDNKVPIIDEQHEIYNADLIYTFNNEKINDYYSRDRQKAKAADAWLAEWLKTNEPYNSYAEYKAANP